MIRSSRKVLLPLTILCALSSASMFNIASAGGLTDAERAELEALLKSSRQLLDQNKAKVNNGYDAINQSADRVNSSFDSLNKKLEESNARGRQRVQENEQYLKQHFPGSRP